MKKKLLIIFYILLIVGTTFLSKSTFNKYKLLEKGDEIEVTILRFPNCNYKSKNDYKFLKFTFENKLYSKKIKSKYCKRLKEEGLFEGSKLRLITNIDRDVFLLPFENILFEIISLIMIELIFVYCLFRLLKNWKGEL